jgi:serine/threonine-protein kinase
MTDQSPVVEGEIVAGRYRIERVLGAGGMGIVVAATHLQLEQRVALKFLLPHAAMIPEVVERFAREARAAVQIQSEHVARVIDVGTLANGAPFMVMEYLEGRDLAEVLRTDGPLSVENAIDYVLQAGEAIADAHRLGIVHRDLKPSNLFLIEGYGVGFGLVKVFDFGISKSTGLAGSAGMTQSASMLGSPAYMSPEQMESARDVDRRTDIWALGVILYELLARALPFTGETFPKLCMEIASQPPAPLRNARPGLPTGLEGVILRCLEKDRRKRFDSVCELAIALGPFAPQRSHLSVERIRALDARSSAPSSKAVSALRAETLVAPEAGTGGTWGKTASKHHAPPWQWALLAAGIVVPGVIAAALLRPSAHPQDRPESRAAAVASGPVPAPAISAPVTASAVATLAPSTPSASSAGSIATAGSSSPAASASDSSALHSNRPGSRVAAPLQSSKTAAPKPRSQEGWEDER